MRTFPREISTKLSAAKKRQGLCGLYFLSKRKNLPGIIIELKADSTPEAAIVRIKDKEYSEKLKKETVETILMAGINYNTNTKEHQCKIDAWLQNKE